MADVHELLDTWIANVKDEELLAELNTMKEQGDEDAITDAFFQDLAFGTAGLRGTIGAGTNRMNIYTVGRATQGFADYLNATFEHPTVAIARDSRNKGELFVKTTAAILAANGVLLRDPLKPADPERPQQMVLPCKSVMVTMVLLKDAKTCTCPVEIWRLTLREVVVRRAVRACFAIILPH